MKKDNIILIGMPGVGKSSAGVVLAKVTGYHFIDSDLVIQRETGKLLKDIIEEEGVDKFIQIENKINSQISEDRAVIATGGSVIYGKEAMEHFKKIGKIVYLKVEYDELCDRLGDLKGRGVAMKEGETLRQLYDERTPLYEKYADIVIEEKGQTIRETVENIAKYI